MGEAVTVMVLFVVSVTVTNETTHALPALAATPVLAGTTVTVSVVVDIMVIVMVPSPAVGFTPTAWFGEAPSPAPAPAAVGDGLVMVAYTTLVI